VNFYQKNPTAFQIQTDNPKRVMQLIRGSRQAETNISANVFENYAFLPLILRARVEGWEVHNKDLHLEDVVGKEQVLQDPFNSFTI
jgi:hypothetical protein